jgi:protein involved in polysaccharide export with SLBB domain
MHNFLKPIFLHILSNRKFILTASLAIITAISPYHISAQQSLDDLKKLRDEMIKKQEQPASQPGIQIIDTRPSDSAPSVQQNNPDKSNYKADNQYSAIETLYNKRLKLKYPLRQYGYDFFKREIPGNFLPVGDSYLVGPGDTVSVYFWGDPVDLLGLNGFYSITVDRDGKIFVPNLGVYYVWGLELGRIKEVLHSALSKKFKRFEIALTLGQLRQFPVYVSGYVNKPGLIQSLGTYSVMDVIVQAGGISKNGSLRNIEIIRKEGQSLRRIKIDMYSLFISGSQSNVQIKEGDSVLVNAIGKTAAVTGDIKRPAIYEIAENETIAGLIENSGGLQFSAYTANAKKLRLDGMQLKIFEGVLTDSKFMSNTLDDGDCLIVQSIRPDIQNEILVTGHVRYPGSFSWYEGIKISDIIRKAELLPDTYSGSADIKRIDSGEVISFVPGIAEAGGSDPILNERDIITFYPRWLFEPLQISGEVTESKLVPYHNGIRILDALTKIKLNYPPAQLKAEIYEGPDKSVKNDTYSSGEIFDTSPVASRPVIESNRTVYLKDLLVKGDASVNIPLNPGSRIVIKVVENNEKNRIITLLGEVKQPGIYNYKPGMNLSDIIETAGGYTEEAYPRGMIFIRRSASSLQMNQINLAMMALEELAAKNTVGFTSAAGGSDEEKMAITLALKQQESLLNMIKKKSQLALGRIALDIPVTEKELKKSRDNINLLEDDYILIPSKPNYVLVLGNVYNQISVPHTKGRKVKDYLSDVGGPAKDSDLDNIYVIKTNGKIITQKSYDEMNGFFMSWFKSFDSMKLEEGDAIVVPFEVNIPIMWRPILRDITQIAFQSISTLVLAQSLSDK